MDNRTFLANQYCTVNAPLVIEMGYVNQKSENYKCLTKINSEDLRVTPLQPNAEQMISNNTLQVGTIGSYSVLVHENVNDTQNLFSFYAFGNLSINNQDALLSIFNQELPAIYKSSNVLNNADNFATTGIMAYLYEFIYNLYYNSISSIGIRAEYNRDWELVYVGAANFLSNAVYPAKCLQTLMQISSLTGTRVKDIAICLSRLLYQFTGVATPIEINYIQESDLYQITLYSSSFGAWVLGQIGSSELGVTTVLTGRSLRQDYFWFIYSVAERLIPPFVKFNFEFRDREAFTDRFNIDIVDADDYILEELVYNAYEVVNNNKNFNTKGYLYVNDN